MTFEEVEPTQRMIHLPPSSFSSLPDEIVENILARVSRWRYPSLSLVSKRFHSLLSSTEIYKTRSQIGATETCVYVCLQLRNHQPPSWFGLWAAKPNHQTRTKRRGKIRFKQDSSGNAVAPINFSSYHYILQPLKVGSEFYIIGGPDYWPSSSVRILDCRSHTWRDAPNMTVARAEASVAFIDDKIYVMGGCDIDDYSANWIEVFDIKTQSWTAMPGPGPDEYELRNNLRELYCIDNVFQGKLYVATDEKDYTYEPRDGTWKVVRDKSSFISDSVYVWCQIENVLYCCTDSGNLMWSDSEKTEDREWREIKGLDIEKLREHRTRGLKTGRQFDMEKCGSGKLLVMWDPYPNCLNRAPVKIWYAKICLESRCNGLRFGVRLSASTCLHFLSNHVNCLIVYLLRFDDVS